MAIYIAESPKSFGTNAAHAAGNNARYVASAGAVIDASAGRDGEPAFQAPGGGGSGGIYYDLPSTLALGSTIIGGMHYKPVGVNAFAAKSKIFLYFPTAVSVAGSQVCGLSQNTDRTIAWWSGTGETDRATSSLLLTVDTHHWISWKVLLASGTTGTISVYVDGVQYINATGVITASNGVRCWKFWGQAIASGGAYSDCILLGDNSGSINNDIIPRKKSIFLPPSADTAQADLAKSTGSDGYALLDETTANDDTDYIVSDTEGDESLFEHANGITGEICAITVRCRARKDGAGGNGVKTVIESGGNKTTSALYVPTASYSNVALTTETDPATSAQWAAGANTLTFGPRVTASA